MDFLNWGDVLMVAVVLDAVDQIGWHGFGRAGVAADEAGGNVEASDKDTGAFDFKLPVGEEVKDLAEGELDGLTVF